MTTSPRIACTLASGDYADRVAWIAELNREYLRSYHQSGLTLELVYASAARSKIRDLVRREEKCCAFLHFIIDDASNC